MGFPLVNAGNLRRTPCFIIFQYNKQEQRVDDICKLPYLFPFSFQEDVGKDDGGLYISLCYDSAARCAVLFWGDFVA